MQRALLPLFLWLILLAGSPGQPALAAERAGPLQWVPHAVVSVVVANGLGTGRGSGFCIGDGSWVVTCRHVVTVEVGAGKRYINRPVKVLSSWLGEAMAAEVVAVDEGADLALLRLPKPGLPALALAGETEREALQRVGEGGPALAIAGYAQPADGADASADVRVQERETRLVSQSTSDDVTHLLLRPAADVGKGWSGGPLLLRESGAVVGVFRALIMTKDEPGVWFPQSVSVARVENLLKRAGVEELAPFRRSSPPAVTRPADAETLFRHEYRADALSVTRKWPEVEAECRAIVKLRPESARAHNALAVVLEEQGKHEEALAEFAESLRLDPKRARTHLNRGLALQNMGRLEEAEQALRKATELAPEDVEAWMGLGNLLAARKQFEPATAALRKAVALSPYHPLARWTLGIRLVQGGNVDEGLAEMRATVALVSDFPPLRKMHLQFAQFLQSLGRLDEAETEYRRILTSMEENPAAHLLFATFLRGRGKKEEALAHARRSLELKPPASLVPAAEALVRSLSSEEGVTR